jgi:hypothetical protein
MKQISEEYLANEIWWWRPNVPTHPPDFKSSNSLAFNYELARRYKRNLKLQPFPFVAGLCRFSAPELDDAPPELWTFRHVHDKAQKEKGWFSLHPNMQWNLNLCDAILQRTFLEFIHQERKKDAIPKPRRNAGRRNKPIPWRWLELMDITDFKIRLLGDNDQSTVRTARRKAKEKWLILSQCVARHTKFQFDNWLSNQGEPGFTDEEDLGFKDIIESSPPAKTHFKLWRGIWPTEIINK